MDWLVGAITILAMELIARRKWYGWGIALINQIFWGWMIIERGLWGLAPLCFVLGWRYSVALIRWRKSVLL
jgi:hypothetical protein